MNEIVQSGHIWLLLSLNFLLYYYASARIMPPTLKSKVNQLIFFGFSYQNLKSIEIIASPDCIWIQESIKRIFNSGLFWVVGAAEKNKIEGTPILKLAMFKRL